MTEQNNDRPAFEPLRAIGMFLAVFGLAVIGAAFLEMPGADKVINAVSGIVILAAGVGAFILGMSRSASKKHTENRADAD